MARAALIENNNLQKSIKSLENQLQSTSQTTTQFRNTLLELKSESTSQSLLYESTIEHLKSLISESEIQKSILQEAIEHTPETPTVTSLEKSLYSLKLTTFEQKQDLLDQISSLYQELELCREEQQQAESHQQTLLNELNRLQGKSLETSASKISDCESPSYPRTRARLSRRGYLIDNPSALVKTSHKLSENNAVFRTTAS